MCLLFSHGEVSIADILDAMKGHRLASVICRIMVNSYLHCAWELSVVMADEYPQIEPRDGMASPLNVPCIACVDGLFITISSQMHSFTVASILVVRPPHKFQS